MQGLQFHQNDNQFHWAVVEAPDRQTERVRLSVRADSHKLPENKRQHFSYRVNPDGSVTPIRSIVTGV